MTHWNRKAANNLVSRGVEVETAICQNSHAQSHGPQFEFTPASDGAPP
jgi:hypothetical protein